MLFYSEGVYKGILSLLIGSKIIMDKQKEIEQYKKKINDLERQVETERRQKLLNLHKELGFASRKDLIAALQSPSAVKAKGKRRKGRRTVITPEMRKQIQTALRGKTPGTVVAREFGISVPTVQNIKKEIGLVGKKKKKKK